jgi:hypothetical protein
MSVFTRALTESLALEDSLDLTLEKLGVMQSLSQANRIAMEQLRQETAAATAQADDLQGKMSGMSGGLMRVPGMSTMGTLGTQSSSGGMREVATGDFTDALSSIEAARRTSRAGA